MNRLTTLLDSDTCANLLAALLHSLWQALAIAGLLFLLLRSKVAKDANVRYIAALIALTAVLVCGLFTWAILEFEPPSDKPGPSLATEPPSAPVPAGRAASGDVRVQTLRPENVSHSTVGATWQKWAICVWMLGAGIMLLRAVCTAVGGARLRRHCRPLDDNHVSALVEQLRQSIGIGRRIRVAVSKHISVPGVVGCVWPTLLLPASMMTGVPIDDLRAIIAHELAHVRRYDYVVNFCQMVVEAIFFFNPAVWWISKQIRFEREACCDKAGVAATGERIRYAEILADWARRLRDGGAGAAVQVVAFGRMDDRGGILERVRRIVVAGHSPRLKVSWYIATITLILSVAVLVGLWRGTTMTVALAGKLLTPEQRIDKIRQIEQTHPAFEKREYTDDDKITIFASVKTIDGKPLDKMTHVRISNRGPNGSGTQGIQISRSDTAPFTRDGLLAVTVDYGIIWLQVQSEGYAPAFAGPLQTEPGGEIKDLSFVLDKGFEGTVKIVNQDTEPVGGAKLVGDYRLLPGVSYGDISTTTDENGVGTVVHAAAQPVDLTVTAEGYEVEKFEDIKLDPEKPVVLKLTPAKETTGVVFSKETGRPVPNAEIKVLITDGPAGSHSYGPEQGRILATTDEQGQFALRTLRSDSRYLLTVEAPGLGHRIMHNVIAGGESLEIYLPGELTVKGRIVGPLEKLRRRDGEYVIGYSFGISSDHHSHWTSTKDAAVEVRDGEGFFEIAAVAGNRMSIGLGSYRKAVDIEDDLLDEVLIDLSDPVTEAGRDYKNREVIVKFDYPEGSPAPEGKLTFKYLDPEFASNTYKNEEITIRNGQGRLRIPTPGKVAYDNSGITGYWFGKKSEVEVPYAEEPFVVTISAVPAGSIYGEVFEHDGSKIDNILVGVVVVEKSPLMGDVQFLNVEGKNSASEGELDTRYVISPLPLGGKYVLIAHRGDLYAASDQITLDEAQPIRHMDITLPKGKKFEIRVLDENGKPKPSAPVNLGYDTQWSHGYSRSARYTNAEGTVVIDRLNPSVPGTYRVVVKDVAGYRPVKMEVEDFDRPLEIKLEPGHVATGVVVDNETGWPIPGAEVYALPTDYRVPEPTTYLDADDVTDEQGGFTFSTMARREYSLNVRSGRLIGSGSNAVVTGGDQKAITLRVKLSEWSRLKPRKP